MTQTERNGRLSRWLAGLVVACAGAMGGCGWLYDSIGGAFRYEPHEMADGLSPEAAALVARGLEDIDPERFTDHHVHVFTHDLHPRWLSSCHPFTRGRTMVFLSAAGVSLGPTMPEDYVDRLTRLADHFPTPGRFLLYAMDHTYRHDGTLDADRTEFHVPNAYVFELASARPERFVPVISVHPFRSDALERLEHWHAEGARFVKWIPNTMGFNPSDRRLRPFYDRMRELDMVLLSHTGDENAVEAVWDGFGNPQLLWLPLEMGVRTVALHAASEGDFTDMYTGKWSRGFDLLMTMMDEPAYEGLLFAELSAVTFFNHLDYPLRTLLKRTDLHHRLLNGSDYPLSALRLVVRPTGMMRRGLLTLDEARALDEVYHYNPLLYDMLVKRFVRHPETGDRFDAEVFHTPEPLMDAIRAWTERAHAPAD